MTGEISGINQLIIYDFVIIEISATTEVVAYV